jgi:fructokinase
VIIVAGEALIDLMVHPDGRLTAVPGGGPFNAARTIARLGQAAGFLGRISTDAFGRILLANLEADGVATDHVATTDDPTTLAVAEIDARGTASYRFYLDGTSAPGLTDADAADVLTQEVAALHIGTLGLVLEPVGTTIERLVGSTPPSVLVMLDPNCRPSATRDAAAFRARIERLARRADVVKVSDDDLRFVDPNATPDRAIDRLLAFGVRVVLRTDGGRSVEVWTASGRVSVPVPEVEVVDTVGAGDAFGGGFLAAWIGAGLGRVELTSLDQVARAATFAIRVAGLTCTRAGADPPSLDELGTAIAQPESGSFDRGA